MKKLLFLFLVAFTIGLLTTVACKHSEVKPPVVILPPPPPPPAPVVHKEAEFCKAEGKHFQCGTNLWWHLDCSGKENEANEQVYFNLMNDIAAKANEKQIGACVKVHLKNGDDVMLDVVGAGPCLPCSEL